MAASLLMLHILCTTTVFSASSSYIVAGYTESLYTCPSNTTDVCEIRCAVGIEDRLNPFVLNCNNASICRYYCDVRGCFNPLTVNMQNSENFELISVNGYIDSCFYYSQLVIHGGEGIDLDVNITGAASGYIKWLNITANNTATMRVTSTLSMPLFGGSGIIDGRNAENLFVTAGADSVYKDYIMYAPGEGDAYFDMSAEGGLAEMTVNAGRNTNAISINCSWPNFIFGYKTCKDITVNAETAQYLEIVADVSGSGIGSLVTVENTVITCPKNSNFEHDEYGTSCALITANGGELRKLTVNAYEGYPKNLYVSPGTITDELVIQCGEDYTTSSNVMTQFSDLVASNLGQCWISQEPPSQSPSIPVSTVQPNDSGPDPTAAPTLTSLANPTAYSGILATVSAEPEEFAEPTTAPSGTVVSSAIQSNSENSETNSLWIIIIIVIGLGGCCGGALLFFLYSRRMGNAHEAHDPKNDIGAEPVCLISPVAPSYVMKPDVRVPPPPPPATDTGSNIRQPQADINAHDRGLLRAHSNAFPEGVRRDGQIEMRGSAQVDIVELNDNNDEGDNSSSDSSLAMHEDHHAVLKVTNFNGVDDGQKLQIFERDPGGEQNADYVLEATETKGTKN